MDENIKQAVDYVRQQMDEDELAVVRAQRMVCWDHHMPIQTDYDDTIHDLLEEYGEEHELSEEWWSETFELDDIIIEL